MRCETCQGCGRVGRVYYGLSPCPDCNGSGISHCCDGIQEQRDPGDETTDHHDSMVAGLDEICPGWLETRHMNPLKAALLRNNVWPAQLGQMERDVTGCADDCCHPSHNHMAPPIVVPPSMLDAAKTSGFTNVIAWKYLPLGDPDTHDEWRKLNDGE